MPVAGVPADDGRSDEVAERGLIVLDVDADRRPLQAQLEAGFGLLAAVGHEHPEADVAAEHLARRDPGDDPELQKRAGVQADRQPVRERDEICRITLVVVGERLNVGARRRHEARHRRLLGAEQIDAGGCFGRACGLIAGTGEGHSGDEQQKRCPPQAWQCCHCATFRVVNARTMSRLHVLAAQAGIQFDAEVTATDRVTGHAPIRVTRVGAQLSVRRDGDGLGLTGGRHGTIFDKWKISGIRHCIGKRKCNR